MKPWKIIAWSAFGGLVQGVIVAVIATAVVVLVTEAGLVPPGGWRTPLLLSIGGFFPLTGLALGIAEGAAKTRQDG